MDSNDTSAVLVKVGERFRVQCDVHGSRSHAMAVCENGRYRLQSMPEAIATMQLHNRKRHS